jgi:hypothetical protein
VSSSPPSPSPRPRRKPLSFGASSGKRISSNTSAGTRRRKPEAGRARRVLSVGMLPQAHQPVLNRPAARTCFRRPFQ